MARSKLRASGANQTMGPLEGVKVIDMTTVLMAPDTPRD
jgi:crotonobetainyl-CoA:carnitine CoA-transferase CaiB-like acyl-CoA transferase